MRYAILQVELAPDEVSLKKVRRKFKIAAKDIDADFGVVEVRPEEHQYAIRVSLSVIRRLRDDGPPGRTPDSGEVEVALVH